jgi:hypothetical protein
MANSEQIVSSVLGGIVGFVIGGPVGAARGAHLGVAVGAELLPDDSEDDDTQASK